MTKENFLKSAKIIIIAWLVFLLLDTTLFMYNASKLTETSGVYLRYIEVFLEQVADGTRELDELMNITEYKNNQYFGRGIVAGVRLLILLPWLFSIKTIKNNKDNKYSFLVLIFVSALVIGYNWTTFDNFPEKSTEGLQTWFTYTTTILNYPVAIATFTWSILWLNSKVRQTLIKPATTIQEQKKKFEAM